MPKNIKLGSGIAEKGKKTVKKTVAKRSKRLSSIRKRNPALNKQRGK